MRNMTLSCKVFLGGVPWDITEAALFGAFKAFGTIRIEWPGKDNTSIPKGYLYVIFENEKQVLKRRWVLKFQQIYATLFAFLGQGSVECLYS